MGQLILRFKPTQENDCWEFDSSEFKTVGLHVQQGQGRLSKRRCVKAGNKDVAKAKQRLGGVLVFLVDAKYRFRKTEASSGKFDSFHHAGAFAEKYLESVGKGREQADKALGWATKLFGCVCKDGKPKATLPHLIKYSTKPSALATLNFEELHPKDIHIQCSDGETINSPEILLSIRDGLLRHYLPDVTPDDLDRSFNAAPKHEAGGFDQPRDRQPPNAGVVDDRSTDRLLELYCDQRCREWRLQCGIVNHESEWSEVDPEDILYYVEPHYSLVSPNHATPDVLPPELQHPETTEQPAEDPAAEIDELANVLRQASDTRRVCVAEHSGLGKSVFTQRLLEYFSSDKGRQLFDRRPCLAVRWEAGHRPESTDWPTTVAGYREALIGELRGTIGEERCNKEQAGRLVDELIKMGRLVLILDALDQTQLLEDDSDPESSPTPQAKALQDFLKKHKNCWVVMTGREHATTGPRLEFFSKRRWHHLKIHPFDVERQYEYLTLCRLPEDRPLITEIAPEKKAAARSNEGAEHTLAKAVWGQEYQEYLPRLQHLIRAYLRDRSLADQYVDEQSLAELCRQQLETLFGTYEEVAPLIQVPIILSFVRKLKKDHNLERFQTSTELYQQACRHLIEEAVPQLALADNPGDVVRRVEQILAAVAFEMIANPKPYFDNEGLGYEVEGIDRIDALRTAARDRCPQINDQEWDRDWQTARKATGLTKRAMLDAWRKDRLAFRHPSLRDYYCGLHLAKNEQSGWVTSETTVKRTRIRCGDDAVLLNAHNPAWEWAWRFTIELTPSLPNQKTGVASLSELFRPPDKRRADRRASELIWRVWNVMKPLPAGESVLAEFLAEFKDRIAARDEIALQLVPEPRLLHLQLSSTERERIENKEPEERNFASCPMEGSPEPRTFFLQTTTVTREQFAIYDPHYLQVESKLLEKYAPTDACPAIRVSWYDAWCFALWVGGRLPTECEWEYACRAGCDGKWCFGDNEKMLDEYAWYGEHLDSGSTHPVATKRPNAWGLYDMHGNVWEWCEDWFDPERYTKRTRGAEDAALQTEVFPADSGPAVGSLRVLRGGGWYFNADNCRSASRNRSTPDLRNGLIGFRLLFDC